MLVAPAALLFTARRFRAGCAAAPKGPRALSAEHESRPLNLLGGIGLRAAGALLLAELRSSSSLSTGSIPTGKFMLADIVSRYATRRCGKRRALGKRTAGRRVLWRLPVLVHARRLLIQLFLVSGIYRWWACRAHC